MSRKEQNREPLQDWLDGVLPEIAPKGGDPDQQFKDKAKGESRPLLYESSLERMEHYYHDKNGEIRYPREESHEMLLSLLVGPSSRLARDERLAYSAFCDFVFTAPAGYEAILKMEEQGRRGYPKAAAIAPILRYGFERTLDFLEEKGHSLDVKVLPRPDSRKQAVVDRRRERARNAYKDAVNRTGRHRDGVVAVMESEGYAQAEAYRLVEDMKPAKAG